MIEFADCKPDNHNMPAPARNSLPYPELPMSLSTRQKRFLRGLTHNIHPVVTVAEKGLSENVLAELESSLNRHELIKVKLRGDKARRTEWIRKIENHTGAEKIHVIGQVACFYRRNDKEAVITLPQDA